MLPVPHAPPASPPASPTPPRAPRPRLAAAPPVAPTSPTEPRASDAELLGRLLAARTASSPPGAAHTAIAAALLDDVGGLAGLGRLEAGGLEAAGLGAAEARALADAIALGRRCAAAAAAPRPRLRGTADVVAWATPRLAALDHEELWALGLDGRGGLVVARAVGLGGTHGMSVAPRDVLRVLLRAGAAAFVLVHNHPSGDPSPSAEDRTFTEAMAVAAELVGVPLCDHVIVAREGFAVVEPRPLAEEPGRRQGPTTGGRRRTSSSASRS